MKAKQKLVELNQNWADEKSPSGLRFAGLRSLTMHNI